MDVLGILVRLRDAEKHGDFSQQHSEMGELTTYKDEVDVPGKNRI